jgi:hypothetical protein
VKDTFTNETNLTREVVAWLGAQGWETYREVAAGPSSKRADICAVSGPWLWVVECKMRLGFDVIAQALDWSRYANMISVAVPDSVNRRGRGRRLAEEICREKGLGLILATPSCDHWPVRWGHIPPRLRRTKQSTLARALHEDMRNFDGEATGGGYYTPFRGTCERLKDLVNARPGIALKDAIEALDHHYANDTSARCHLVQYIRRGIIEGIEVEGGRPLRLHPEKEET